MQQASGGMQQRLLVGCAWMAAGAVGARLCGAGQRVAAASSQSAAAAATNSATIRDVDLLYCASIFLFSRTGGCLRGLEPPPADVSSLLAVDVQAYGASGRSKVLAALQAKATAFPNTVLSVAASALSASVRVAYHDGSSETICCCRGEEQQVLVRQVITHREAQPEGAAAAAAEAEPSSAGATASGVELLWWAMRFLHADINRDYAAQRRYLAPDAAAFGAAGREAILAANGETLPEAEKTAFTVPYPITVDTTNSTIALLPPACTPLPFPNCIYSHTCGQAFEYRMIGPICLTNTCNVMVMQQSIYHNRNCRADVRCMDCDW